MQNGYIKSFNGKFRDECLNEQWFDNLIQATPRKSINLENRTSALWFSGYSSQNCNTRSKEILL